MVAAVLARPPERICLSLALLWLFAKLSELSFLLVALRMTHMSGLIGINYAFGPT